MRDSDRERGVIDRGQPRFSEKLRQVTITGSGQLALALDVGIELANGIPENTEWSPTAVVIPHAGSHDPTGARHPAHLPQATEGIFHKVDDELGQGDVEGAVLEGELFRRCSSHIDCRVSLLGGGDKGLGGIDGDDASCSQAGDEFSGQCAGAATHIEHS